MTTTTTTAPTGRASAPAADREDQSSRPDDSGRTDGGGRERGRAARGPSSRNRAIDGYRGLCAIGVVFGHTVLINQLIFTRNAHEAIWTLFDVLPMFFALSGLMTYRVWVLGALNGRVPKRIPTITGRLWRLLPVYYALVLVIWAMHFVDSGADWADLALHLSFMQVWSPTYVFWLDGPAWFLSDDMHLFVLGTLLGPTLCQLALRFPLTRWGLSLRMLVMSALPLAMVTVGSVWIWLQVIHDHHTSAYVRYTPLFVMPEFAFGMLLAVIMFSPGVTKVRPKLSLALTTLGLAGLAVIAYYGWRISWMNFDEFGYPLISVFCCVLLAGALMAPPRGGITRVLGIRPLQWLAGLGLTILLVQEPLMIILEKWGFVAVDDPTACWISAVLLTMVAAGVAWLALVGIERPALALRDTLRRVSALETGRDRRHRGPIPRMLPDIALELRDGERVSVRSVLGDRPLLLAFGEAGSGALAEQQFRLDAGESRALHVATAVDRSALASAELGADIALDPDAALSRALNVPVALVEVAPDGHISSFQRAQREAFGAWA